MPAKHLGGGGEEREELMAELIPPERRQLAQVFTKDKTCWLILHAVRELSNLHKKGRSGREKLLMGDVPMSQAWLLLLILVLLPIRVYVLRIM